MATRGSSHGNKRPVASSLAYDNRVRWRQPQGQCVGIFFSFPKRHGVVCSIRKRQAQGLDLEGLKSAGSWQKPLEGIEADISGGGGYDGGSWQEPLGNLIGHFNRPFNRTKCGHFGGQSWARRAKE